MRALAPVTLVASLPFMLAVHPSVPAANLAEFVALAKAKPGQLNYASVGNGSLVHLATELLKKRAGVELVHVPYKGSAPALNGLLAGDASAMFVNLLSAMPLVKAGKLRALATSPARRLSASPEIPSVAEAGVPGYDFEGWFGIIAPAATPRPILERLTAELRRIVAQPDVRERLIQQGGLEPIGGSAEQFAAFLPAEIRRWGALVREAGARVD